ncbi:hypothetical protein EDC01DRAFT_664102 [Geopyxis carbonaria]|nr:hypothetical protein EDC01DRAFT_664102 [Geopyxis carbonaria]
MRLFLPAFAALYTSILPVAAAPKACKLLAATFPEDLSYPDTVAYTVLNTYWATNTAQSPPCIFTPRTPAAVARALRILTATSTQFSVRSGGHSFIPTWSSTSTGVAIHLSALASIVLSADKATVHIGAGARWGDVYTALESHALSVPGGRASTIGVGGLTLGGGLSYFLTTHGFACDNIDAIDVVTAGGRVLTVSAHSHADLFRALKGSGAPFAVVTGFKFRTVRLAAAGHVWGGMLTSAGADTGAIIDAAVAYAEPTGGITDTATHLIAAVGLTAGPNATSLQLGINILFSRMPGTTTPAAFTRNVAASQQGLVSSTLGVKPLSALSREVAGEGLPPARHEMYPFTLRTPSAALLRELYAIMQDVFAPVLPAVPGLALTLNMIPIAASAFAVGAGRNVLGLKADGNGLMSVHFFLQWDNARDDAAVHAAVREAYRNCVATARAQGALVDFVYMNYANPDQDPIASYGEAEVAFLRAVKRRWDPEGVWGRLVKGGWRIPE